MKINLIAVHYNIQNNEVEGFRLLDSDSGQVMDQPYASVYKVIASNAATITGIELDKSSNKLKGSNGAFNRYPCLYNNSCKNNSLVIIASIDDKGYRVCNYLGKCIDALSSYVIQFAVKNGIANGKVVEKDGRKYISAINGSYSNIVFNNSTLKGSKEAQRKMADRAYSDKMKQEIINHNRKYGSAFKFPRVITGVANADSKLHEVDPDTGLTVEQKMANAMIAMKKTKPFYYSVYSCLKRVEAAKGDDVKTMCVSLDTLYFNSDFVLEKTSPELLFILIHEVSHIAMKHRVRENGRDHEVWNRACDYFINKQIADDFGLKELGDTAIAKSRFSNSTESIQFRITLPTDCLFNKNIDVDVDTPEKLYEELMKLAMQNQGNSNNGNDSNSENGNDNTTSGAGDAGDNEENSAEAGGGNSSDGQQGGSSSNGPSLDDDEQSGEDKTDLEDFAGGKDPKEKEQNTNELQAPPKKSNKSNTKNDETGEPDGEDSSESGDGQGKKGKKAKGRLVGKEFRGQEIPDIEIDIVDDGKQRGMSKEQMQQSANALLSRAVTIHRQTHQFGGDNADWLERYVEKALAPKINWRSLLKNKLTVANQKINTFAAPDKRFRSRGMIMPGPKKLDNDSLDNVKICVDTSGSISPKDLGVALAQVEQLLKQFKAEAEMIYWDTRVRAIYPFKDVKELINKSPMGGGGTDANCIFEYFETDRDYKIGKKKKPTIIVVFTDGYFGTIEAKYSKYKDTIWVIHDNQGFKAPFGSKAQLKIED